MTGNVLEIKPSEITILAIDDDSDSLSLFKATLRRANYKVETAVGGEEGLLLAQTFRPDLILCDIMMPGMDGRKVFEELRKHSATATIPFVFLTALGTTEDIVSSLRLGVDDYLVKPVTTQTLLHSVETRLLKHQRIQAAQMQRMTKYLLQTREYERQRVASKLQNDVYQNLLGLKMSLGLLEDKENPTLQAEVVAAINATIEQVEKLTQELHPTVLDHVGLVTGIRWLLEQYDDLDIIFDAHDSEYNLESRLKQTIVRVLREALDNVVAHAQTMQITVEVYYKESTIEITLTDRGIGFDLETVMASSDMGGLMRMHELASMIGAFLTVTSNPGAGTVVHIQVAAETQAVTETNMPNIMRSLMKNQPLAESTFSSRTRIPLVVAIEQSFLRQGMIRLLSNIPQLLILAECNQLATLESIITKYHPLLLIINPISLESNQFQHDIMDQIVQAHQDLHILMVGANREKEYALNALNNGAHGYIPYNTTLNDLYTAINVTARGEFYVSPRIALERPP